MCIVIQHYLYLAKEHGTAFLAEMDDFGHNAYDGGLRETHSLGTKKEQEDYSSGGGVGGVSHCVSISAI